VSGMSLVSKGMAASGAEYICIFCASLAQSLAVTYVVHIPN
jgi:hypothetical protein